jgi:hypothetical protein
MIYFIYFVFIKWVQRNKIFQWCSKFTFKHFIWVAKIFKKSIVSKKFTQKDFLLSTFIQKGLWKIIKSLLNWIQMPSSLHFPSLCCHQGISISRMTLEIKSYLSINLPLLLFGLLHLPKCYSSCVKVTPSCEAQ